MPSQTNSSRSQAESLSRFPRHRRHRARLLPRLKRQGRRARRPRARTHSHAHGALSLHGVRAGQEDFEQSFERGGKGDQDAAAWCWRVRWAAFLSVSSPVLRPPPLARARDARPGGDGAYIWNGCGASPSAELRSSHAPSHHESLAMIGHTRSHALASSSTARARAKQRA
jgi:hypothetical protein